jgi:hypothetical protein
MSMTFIAGAAAALTIGGLVLGGLAVAPGDGSFEEIRPYAAPQVSRTVAPRAMFIQPRRFATDADEAFGRSEGYAERFTYGE